MLLTSMIWFISHFMMNPTFTDKTPGSYVQIVHSDYDPVNNLTYAVEARFDIYQDSAPHVFWMEPLPFTGQPKLDTSAQRVPFDFMPDQAAELLANQLAE